MEVFFVVVLFLLFIYLFLTLVSNHRNSLSLHRNEDGCIFLTALSLVLDFSVAFLFEEHSVGFMWPHNCGATRYIFFWPEWMFIKIHLTAAVNVMGSKVRELGFTVFECIIKLIYLNVCTHYNIWISCNMIYTTFTLTFYSLRFFFIHSSYSWAFGIGNGNNVILLEIWTF